MTHAEFSDLGDTDEFFRRGDEYSATSNSLEPPMGRDVGSDSFAEEAEPASLRTPLQEARRQKFARRVSVGMTVLALGTAGALLGHLHARGSQPALAVAEARQDTGEAAQPLAKDNDLTAVESTVPPSGVGASALASPTVAVVAPVEPESAAASAPAVAASSVEKSTTVASPAVSVVEVVAGNSAVEKSSLAVASAVRGQVPSTKAFSFAKLAAVSSVEGTKRPVAVPATSSAVRVSSSVVTKPKPAVSARPSIAAGNRARPVGYQPPTVSFSD